ncbi:hypothetical protein HPB49_011818 [Dermacentor silvarum]|uniref:Uncharacterized protein n=1 Tax=Dermacentor silvarum TaxID=543639 RepID=A0ACB8CX38_DERSI|nr:hypothetical protein HPB49_011818 [Dermacentor silvarum]
MVRHPPHLNLRQCNCRGFRGRWSTLQVHLQNISPDTLPSVIVLQERLAPVKLSDYTSFHPSSEAHPNVATLLDVSDCAHLLLEILPRRRTEASLFVLNVYSPPKAPSAPILLVLRKALSCAGHNALVVLGDFNTPHASWAYPQNTRKGHSLWTFIRNESLSIFSDFAGSTRIGSSAQKHNRRLRLRLARLTSDIEEHCSSLLRQQWGQTSDHMTGNLGLHDTWSFLSVLLDPTHTTASQRKDISHLLHSSPLTNTDCQAALGNRHLCTDPPTPLPSYTGSPNPDLEADIFLGEVPLSHAGVDVVATHARSIGLNYSPAKSELLLLLPQGMALLSPSSLSVSLDGSPLPFVSTLRILGLSLQSNGKHTTLITRLRNTVRQTIRLIRRIANRHHGLREHDLCRLVQAFVLSHFIYSLPYLFLSRTEEDKVNSLIRQTYKLALSLPTSTSTARLLSMGVDNSTTELTEAHPTVQLLRLSRTRPGRAHLSTLKLSPLTPHPTSLPIPSYVSSLLTINPLPKNMHPEHHPSRRRTTNAKPPWFMWMPPHTATT